MEISETGLSARVNSGGNWDLQKICSLWKIKVSWDVMLLGVTNQEYVINPEHKSTTSFKNGENYSLSYTVPHSRMPVSSVGVLQQSHLFEGSHHVVYRLILIYYI
jgi:hypothetical protein